MSSSRQKAGWLRSSMETACTGEGHGAARGCEGCEGLRAALRGCEAQLVAHTHSAHAVHTRCARSAHALHAQCMCSAHTAHTQCASQPCRLYLGSDSLGLGLGSGSGPDLAVAALGVKLDEACRGFEGEARTRLGHGHAARLEQRGRHAQRVVPAHGRVDGVLLGDDKAEGGLRPRGVPAWLEEQQLAHAVHVVAHVVALLHHRAARDRRQPSDDHAGGLARRVAIDNLEWWHHRRRRATAPVTGRSLHWAL
eukprot:scaffold52377_cov72-Phaeocystis_antarctica.AAC.6